MARQRKEKLEKIVFQLLLVYYTPSTGLLANWQVDTMLF